MTARFSLSYLTAPVEDPFEAADIAREAGYAHLGLRLRHPATGEPASPLVGDAALRRAFKARLAADHLSVIEIEAWVLSADPGESRFDAAILEAAADLGEPRLIAVADQAGRVGVGELCERFAALCETAAGYGLGVGFEPISHRAGGDLASALSIVAAGAPWRSGLVLDTLHIRRMSLTPADLRTIDPALLHVIQLCDAPREAPDLATKIDHSAFNRWPPGEGELPLADYLRALPSDRPFALEVPMVRHADRLTPRQCALQAIAGARRVFAGL